MTTTSTLARVVPDWALDTDPPATIPAPFIAPPVKAWGDKEPVRNHWAAYLNRRAKLDAAGRSNYNAEFVGHIGVIDTDPKAEDTAIYLLQQLHSLVEMQRNIDDFMADGGEVLTELAATTRFREVAQFGWYSGGTGWTNYGEVRVVPYGESFGLDHPRATVPYGVLPKGKRTRGHALSGTVLVKR